MPFSLRRLGPLAVGVAGAAVLAGSVSAATLNVEITNHQPNAGLYLTPLFFAFHDGTYDPFDAGSPASADVEALAEEGDTSGLQANAGAAKTGVITSPGGFAPLPIIDPGETASVQIHVDPSTDRFFTFLSMVIPSNDNFIGNDNPMAYQVFSGAGSFTGLGPISILGGDVWDAGTEVNNGIGAAFSTVPGVGTDENGVIALQNDLSFLLNTPTPAGLSINSVPGRADLLATIRISQVPLPAGAPLLLAGLGAFAMMRRRKT